MNFLQVCELHFPPSKIIRTTSAFDNNCGKTITCNLKFPKLSFGAVPSIFPNCPAYLYNIQINEIYCIDLNCVLIIFKVKSFRSFTYVISSVHHIALLENRTLV